MSSELRIANMCYTGTGDWPIEILVENEDGQLKPYVSKEESSRATEDALRLAYNIGFTDCKNGRFNMPVRALIVMRNEYNFDPTRWTQAAERLLVEIYKATVPPSSGINSEGLEFKLRELGIDVGDV